MQTLKFWWILILVWLAQGEKSYARQKKVEKKTFCITDDEKACMTKITNFCKPEHSKIAYDYILVNQSFTVNTWEYEL